MSQPLWIGEQPTGLFKAQEMHIKLLDDLVDVCFHPRV
jgi:hypothetical protein